ncbi:LIM homeobox transcription factor 1-beta isoform X1 [Dermacentor silvarum]|uniref:LIM homeobox transcription factor 1-beta isoform X1 n=2 Tax=Dermacentor silvarum TaxID=543639 RepID=UPI0021012636|nr:LIM homeobox transcription factor 1-beta isoform X1 [Dermacentor silvarum]
MNVLRISGSMCSCAFAVYTAHHENAVYSSAPPSGVELGSRKRKAVRMPNLQRWAMDSENSKSTASARGASVPSFRASNTGPESRMRKGSGSKSPSSSSGAPGGCPVAGDDAPATAAPASSHPSAAAASLCAGCGLPIVDRYILRVMEHSWHEACLQCSVCHAPLEQSCYSRDRKLFCKADYDKLFGVKCAGCLGCIAPSELVMRALEHVFHVACFACVVCGRTLQKGDQFVVRAARLYCRPDFEKEMALVSMAQHHANSQPSQPHAPQQHPAAHAPNAALPGARGENGPLPGGGPNGQQPGAAAGGAAAAVRPDGRRGPKRPRTILTTAQRRAFKASFEISQKPCRKVRETLAKETGLSVRIVQVWFQNQRAKLKKIQRKQQQQQQQQQQSQQNAGGDSSGSEMASSTKDSKKSDDGRQSASPADLSSPPFSRLGLLEPSAVGSPYHLQPLPYGTHHDGSYYGPTHVDPTYLKSEISMESETSLSGLEDVLIGAGSGGGQPPPPLSDAMFASSAVNPIDKLYSMQTSYFSNNECECLGGSN